MSIDVTSEPGLSAMVAEEIRVVMARRLMKQSQLARKIGVTEQWLSVRLRGVQEIGLDDLGKIAGGLDVEPAALIAGSGAPVNVRNPVRAHKPRSTRPRDSRPPTAERRPAILRGTTRRR